MPQCSILQQSMSKETPKETQERVSSVASREKVEEMAKRLYELAANQRDVNAMTQQLGVMNYNGHGVKQSHEKAFEYYRQAVHLGASALVKELILTR